MKLSCNGYLRCMLATALVSLSSSVVIAQETGVSRTSWQMHKGKSVLPLASKLTGENEEESYVLAVIPSETDSGWGDAPDPDIIGMDVRSEIPGEWTLNCQKMVDYTYFQTFVSVPASTSVTEFKIKFDGMDDGARISVFNSEHPNGTIVEGSYVKIGETGTKDLQALMVEGRNRVVITQVDNCAVNNRLKSAKVELNGETVEATAPALPEAVKLLAYSINNQVRGSADAAPDYHVAFDGEAGKILKGINIGQGFDVVPVDHTKIALRLHSGPHIGKFLKPADNSAGLGDSEFDPATQFIVRGPLESSVAGSFVSFESVAFPGQFLRHQGFVLKLDLASVQSPSLLRRDATFRFKPANKETSASCAEAIQGKIAWDYQGSKTWNQSNIDRLCGTVNSTEPATCFQHVMHGGLSYGGGDKWSWSNALELCKNTPSAAATISCFRRNISDGHDYTQATKNCNGAD